MALTTPVVTTFAPLHNMLHRMFDVSGTRCTVTSLLRTTLECSARLPLHYIHCKSMLNFSATRRAVTSAHAQVFMPFAQTLLFTALLLQTCLSKAVAKLKTHAKGLSECIALQPQLTKRHESSGKAQRFATTPSKIGLLCKQPKQSRRLGKALTPNEIGYGFNARPFLTSSSAFPFPRSGIVCFLLLLQSSVGSRVPPYYHPNLGL